MAYYGRCVKMPKNKLKACTFCVLLCLANVIDISEARKVATGRVTKPTANRGYASADIAKLSYTPNHAAVPAKTAPAPAQQTPIGWNVQNSNNAPPPYSAVSNHGPPPPYSAQPNPNLNSRFNEQPPAYAQGNPGFPPAPNYQNSQPGFGAGLGAGAVGGVVAGSAFHHHGHNASSGGGFSAVPNQGYPPQSVQGFPGAPAAQPGGGFPGAPIAQPSAGFPGAAQPGAGFSGGFPQHNDFQHGGYPQQPGYQPAPGGFQQQPGTVIHHYEQPSSGGSGLGTVLGAGVVGLAAGAGGAAIYDALKPKDEAKEAHAEPTTTTTTTTTTLAPINPNGDAPLAPMPTNPNGDAPLAPMPVVPPNPNGDTPLAPMPASDTTIVSAAPETTSDGTTTENPLGSAPLATFPVSENSASANTTSAETSSTAATSTVAVEAPNAALNVQPNQAAPAATASQHSDSAGGRVQLSILALLAPVICKFLL